ncbi:hypothetical protein KUTeg_006934 [Tegillarca granosa]|uniref:VWFA domain-containing protein n=1 Tax=Tegillarca granosa TaxID=220873 RepID=A0ABQ9FBS4_TEGGR|nr:hypothetical protein KUTeg_006934 [Tegillarca granosa]
MMDQDEETPDVFTVSVGNLPPGAFVLIKITYVTELQVEGEKISFNVPGSVAPWKQKYSSATEVKDKTWTTHQVEMGWCTVEVAIEMPFDIREIECTSHKIRMKRTASKAVIAIDDGQTIEDGFHLLVSLAEIHVPRMWVESYDGDTDNQACMLTFYPEFEAEEDTSIEVVMLLDLSNSMKGSPLTEAKKIILLTLQHLPSSATFNIVAFGTTYKELFPASRLKNKSNMKLAEGFLESCQANMENTELYRPLHSFYLLKPESAVKNMYFTSESSYKNIFLISDGHINNEETTLEHVYKNSQHTRIFTFGVSSVANRHLLRALARVGAGAYEYFDSKSKSKWENKVKSQISKASQPGLTSVSVAWQQHDEELPPPIQAPRQITALFNGSRQVIYGFVPNCLMATLYAEIAGQQISTVVSTSDLSVTQGKILHRLTAKAVIRDWEDGVLAPDRTDHHVMKMNMKKDIIELSKKYSIVTKLTSFVAIEKREEGKTDKMEMSEYEFKHEFINCKESVDFLSYMQYEDELQDQEDSESSELVGTYSSDSVYDDFDDDELVYECEDDLEGSGEHEEEEPEYLERESLYEIRHKELSSNLEEGSDDESDLVCGASAPGRLLGNQEYFSEGSKEHEDLVSTCIGSCPKRRAVLSVGTYEEESDEEDEDLEFGLFGDGEPIRALRRREGGVAEEMPRSMVEEESISNIAKLCVRLFILLSVKQ